MINEPMLKQFPVGFASPFTVLSTLCCNETISAEAKIAKLIKISIFKTLFYFSTAWSVIRFVVAVYDRYPGIVRDDAMMSPLMIDDAKKRRALYRA